MKRNEYVTKENGTFLSQNRSASFVVVYFFMTKGYNNFISSLAQHHIYSI